MIFTGKAEVITAIEFQRKEGLGFPEGFLWEVKWSLQIKFVLVLLNVYKVGITG